MLKGPCNVFFIIATERLHVQKDILQLRLIIFTDKYEKKNKKSVLQTAPPPWRNLIYIIVTYVLEVVASRAPLTQRLPIVAQRILTSISTTKLHLPKFWIHYFAKCQPGVLLQAPDYNMLF